jgi:hypothetical protein
MDLDDYWRNPKYRDVEIHQVDKPMGEFKGYPYVVKSQIVRNYNEWLMILFEEKAKLVVYTKLWHQLDLDENNKTLPDYRFILHWVRFDILEKFDDDGNTLVRYTIEGKYPDGEIKDGVTLSRRYWIRKDWIDENNS